MGTTSAHATSEVIKELREEANKKLGSVEAGKIFFLLREVMLRLPGKALISADLREIQKAGRAALAAGRSSEEMKLLQQGLKAFFDLATRAGFADRNPIRAGGRATDAPITSTLMLGLGAETIDAAKNSVGTKEGEIETETRVQNAIDMVRWYPFRKIVISHPLPVSGLTDFLREVRHNESPSRDASCVVICDPDKVAEVQTYLGRGVNRVLPLDSIQDLGAVFSGINQNEPRLPLRVPLKVTGTGVGQAATAMWQTENISHTGLLIRTRAEPAPGTTLDFEFFLPGDPRPIRSRAEVVRGTLRGRDPAEGVGARFISFDGDGELRLSSFLATRLG